MLAHSSTSSVKRSRRKKTRNNGGVSSARKVINLLHLFATIYRNTINMTPLRAPTLEMARLPAEPRCPKTRAWLLHLASYRTRIHSTLLSIKSMTIQIVLLEFTQLQQLLVTIHRNSVPLRGTQASEGALWVEESLSQSRGGDLLLKLRGRLNSPNCRLRNGKYTWE